MKCINISDTDQVQKIIYSDKLNLSWGTMNSDVTSKNERGGTFTCGVCGLTELYHYYGRKPPFHKGVTFLEDCYLLQDPFRSETAGSFLLLGAECSACSTVVCQAATCSIFYTKRFCIPCASASMQEFPTEVQTRIKKGISK